MMKNVLKGMRYYLASLIGIPTLIIMTTLTLFDYCVMFVIGVIFGVCDLIESNGEDYWHNKALGILNKITDKIVEVCG